MSDLYNRIDNLCKSNKSNVTAMCKTLNISRSILSELNAERTKTLTTPVLEKISKFLNVSIEYLLTGEEKEIDKNKKYAELDDLEFAMYGDIKAFDDEQKSKLLEYVEFLKHQKQGK